MSKLSLYNSYVNPTVRKFTGTCVPKPVDMHPLGDSTLLRLSLEHFAYIAVGQPTTAVRAEYEVAIDWPGVNPLPDLGDGLDVDTNHPSLTTLAFQYSDGTTVEVDIACSKIKCLIAPELAAKIDKNQRAIPDSGDRSRKGIKDFLKGVFRKYFGRKSHPFISHSITSS